MAHNIKDIVKDNTVTFSHYRDGNMFYNVSVNDFGNPTEHNKKPISIDVYQFPVPLDDIGTATLLNTDKAIIFMRFIRKSIEEGTFVKQPKL